MGACEPGQGRKPAAISGHLQVRWASHRGPERMQGLEIGDEGLANEIAGVGRQPWSVRRWPTCRRPLNLCGCPSP